MRKKSGKKLLISCALSIVLCVFMLAGTTWAWFTDSVTNAGNKIQAGTLDVSLLAAKSDGAGGYGALSDVSESTEPIFKGENWEPGYSTGVKLAVKNNGTLALKYKLIFANLTATKGIEQVLDVTVDGIAVGTLAEFFGGAAFDEGVLAAGATSAEKTVVVTMRTSAGNVYQGAAATFDVRLVAAQTAADAVYPPIDPIDTTLTDTVAPDTETVLESVGTPVKATIPANALPEGTQVTLSVVTESATADSVVYDISLTDAAGTALSPTEKIRIELNIGKGLSGFSVKHNGIPMAEEDYSYDNATGILTIETSSFSPFEVSFVRDAAATVNGESFAALADAFAAAKQNEVIYLWQDAALTADVETGAQILIPSTAAVTFDLAGHKLTSTYIGISVANYGTLTIKDSIGNGILHNTSAEVGDNYSHDAVRNFGTLTINGGTFGDSDMDKTNANTEHRGAAVRNMPGAVCEINGGFFTCGDNYYTWGESTGFSYAIRSSGELTINDATLYGAMNGGVSADAGNIVINGGDFSVTGTTSFYVLVTNKRGGGNITINGGTFTKTGGNGGLLGGFSGMPSWDASEELAANGFTITGGTFVKDGIATIYDPAYEQPVVLPQGVTAETFGTNVAYADEIYYPTLQAAVKSGASVIYCKPGETLTEAFTHIDVSKNLTVYGNCATLTKGERDFAIDTYAKLTSNITLNVYSLNGAAAWGQRTTAFTANLNFYNCRNMNRVYLSGTSGVNNITVSGCSFDGSAEVKANNCTIYSNANGKIDVLNTTFLKVGEPINLNHKAESGTQTINVVGCTFTDCSTVDIDANEWAAPIRVLSVNANASSVLTVKDCVFTCSGERKNSDILLNDTITGNHVTAGSVTAVIENSGTATHTVTGDRVTVEVK